MRIHVIGDLHGFYSPFESLLIDAGIINQSLDWTANTDQLWLIGDVFDRGHQAAACINLTMKLQQQATTAGGRVECLLGNHELMFLAVHKFSNHSVYGDSMHEQWLHWGGQQEEMENITREQVAWLNQLPAMALVKDRLLIHADNLSYVNYGQTVSQVNEYFQQLMRSDDIDQWQRTLLDFSVRGAFNLRISGPKQASLILKMYGGSELIHGHTPIPYTLDVEPNAVIEARNYANGLCWNVDGGIYLGSPGFVYTYD